MFGHEENHRRLRHIEELLERIEHLLRRLIHPHILPTSFTISQKGATMITGVRVGSSGTFVETPIPAGSVVPAGSPEVWTTDDPLVSLAPSTDETSVVASVDPTDTAADFGLTFTATINGTDVSATVRVPIIPLPPPVPTGFSIDQTA